MNSLQYQNYLNHVWQPYTQMRLAPKPILIKKAKGIYLYDNKNRKIIDAIGSWWVNVHGHNHPYINRKLIKQIGLLEHCIYAGLVHEPAIELSQKLANATYGRMPRVFFSDNGSTAIEIALKMAFQYFVNKGHTKKKEIVSLGGGYHGDTIGAMSLGARGIFHEAFEPLLFHCHQLPRPYCPFEELYDEALSLKRVTHVIQAFERIIKKRKGKIFALVLEPLVQAASSGFNFYPKILLEKLNELCKNENIFLILDEVFTGSGRIGSYFAYQKTHVLPDLVALSKGLSNGYLPFSATLATEEIYQGFYSEKRDHTFFHGHSMTANPLGCVCALASLELFESERSLEKIKKIESWHKENLENLMKEKKKDKLRIKEIRYVGSIGVLELDMQLKYISEWGWRCMQKALKFGVLIRPLGNVIYLTPPYSIKENELKKVYEVISRVLSL